MNFSYSAKTWTNYRYKFLIFICTFWPHGSKWVERFLKRQHVIFTESHQICQIKADIGRHRPHLVARLRNSNRSLCTVKIVKVSVRTLLPATWRQFAVARCSGCLHRGIMCFFYLKRTVWEELLLFNPNGTVSGVWNTWIKFVCLLVSDLLQVEHFP